MDWFWRIEEASLWSSTASAQSAKKSSVGFFSHVNHIAPMECGAGHRFGLGRGEAVERGGTSGVLAAFHPKRRKPPHSTSVPFGQKAGLLSDGLVRPILLPLSNLFERGCQQNPDTATDCRQIAHRQHPSIGGEIDDRNGLAHRNRYQLLMGHLKCPGCRPCPRCGWRFADARNCRSIWCPIPRWLAPPFHSLFCRHDQEELWNTILRQTAQRFRFRINFFH